MKLLHRLCFGLSVLALFAHQHVCADFSQKLDVQTRVDDRSNRDIRYQYRLRYYPQYNIDDEWSVNAFVVTGDDFASSHNTFDDGAADYFYIRRAFVRHVSDYGKTEFGIIPTFKGRVSSTGLSKDGWIQGVRHVRQVGQSNQLEVVIGKLDELDPAKALNVADTIDYVEIEYSARMGKRSSYEVSLERMTQANFVRFEFRYRLFEQHTVFNEWVKRAENSQSKVVVGVEGEWTVFDQPLEYFAYYSYVSDDFGLRAELTEDFLDVGNGFSSEISADFAQTDLSWFVRFDWVEEQSRWLAGLAWSW